MFKILKERDKVIGTDVVSENIVINKTRTSHAISGFLDDEYDIKEVERFNTPEFHHIRSGSSYSSYYNIFYEGHYLNEHSLQLFDVSAGTKMPSDVGFAPYKRIIYNNFLKYCGGSSYKDLVSNTEKQYFPKFNNTLYIALKRNLIKDAINPHGTKFTFWGAEESITHLVVGNQSGKIDVVIDNTNTHYKKNANGMHFNVLKTNGFTCTFEQQGNQRHYTSSFENGGSILGIVNIDAGLFIFDLDRLYYLGYTNSKEAEGDVNNYLSCTPVDHQVAASFDSVVKSYFISETSSAVGKFCKYEFMNRINLISCTYHCYLDSNEFNYSSNPTYVDNKGLIRVVSGSNIDDKSKPCTYITGIGLYDMQDNLLAVAKLSRPVKKNFDNSLTFRVRLDY